MMRPEFIPREKFRNWQRPNELNKIARIDGILVSSYLARCEREGKPILSKPRHGFKTYRMLDVVARARAYNLAIDPPIETQLLRDIQALQAEKAKLIFDVENKKHELSLNLASSRLTGATLLTEDEIAACRLDLPTTSGVYFLLQGGHVVYVGQAVSVFMRVLDHLSSKDFDGFAYIPCERHKLDVLESLYIHTLRPKLNGKTNSKEPGICAPLRLDALLGA